jgi:hypothetical protein
MEITKETITDRDKQQSLRELFERVNYLVHIHDNDFVIRLLECSGKDLFIRNYYFNSSEYFDSMCPKIVECHGDNCRERDMSTYCESCNGEISLAAIIEVCTTDSLLHFADISEYCQYSNIRTSLQPVNNLQDLCVIVNGTSTEIAEIARNGTQRCVDTPCIWSK